MTDQERKAMEMALEWMEAIVNSNWRNWEELASPEEFERWVKSRANHCAEALRQALAQKNECETCAAKRKRLTDAGLLKSPLRSDDAIDTSSTCVDENEKREHEPVAWMQVSDGLPRSGITVLACYKNRLGNLRRIRAHWVAAKTIETSVDYGECYEYDEETDEYYLLEGWYECIDNWDEYSSVAVCEGEVTHWMPLPPEPDEEYTAPPSKQEPVAWTLTELLDKRETTTNAPLWFVDPVNSAWAPLYTAPPSKPWVSLSDEEIHNIYDEIARRKPYNVECSRRNVGRAIEAALRSKNNG